MKKALLIIYIAALGFYGAGSAMAQNGEKLADSDINLERAARSNLYVTLGGSFAIGGTSPMPMPRSIRKIESFNPLLNLGLEGTVYWNLSKNNRWAVSLTERFNTQGMKTDASVKGYHMEMTADDGGFMEGDWTGRVKTRVHNTYLTFVPKINYNLNRRVAFSGGIYLSYLLNGDFSGSAYDGYLRHHDPTGDKAYVTHATYDFSDSLRRFAWGAELGVSYRAYRHLQVSGNLDWGFNGIFPSDFGSVNFALYPIYLNVGFNYIF